MFFMSPVIAGYIKYTDLIDGGLNIYDIYIMNELIEYKYNYENAMYDISKEDNR